MRADRRENANSVEKHKFFSLFYLFFFFLPCRRTHSRSLIWCIEYDDERTQVGTDRVYVARFQCARSLFQAAPAKTWTTFNRKPDIGGHSLVASSLFNWSYPGHNNKDQRYRGAWRRIGKRYINTRKRSSLRALCVIHCVAPSEYFDRPDSVRKSIIKSKAPHRTVSRITWKEKKREKKESAQGYKVLLIYRRREKGMG